MGYSLFDLVLYISNTLQMYVIFFILQIFSYEKNVMSRKSELNWVKTKIRCIYIGYEGSREGIHAVSTAIACSHVHRIFGLNPSFALVWP